MNKVREVGLEYLKREIDDPDRTIRIIEPIIRLGGDNYHLGLRDAEGDLCATLSESEFDELRNYAQLNNPEEKG